MSDAPPDIRDSLVYDPETERYRAGFDSSTIDPSIATIQVVAEVCDAEPTELPPLYEVIDPLALNNLFPSADSTQSDGDLRVEFTYHGHRVSLESYGIIEVRPHTVTESTDESVE